MNFFDYGTIIPIRKHKIKSKYSQDRQIHAFLIRNSIGLKKEYNEVASPYHTPQFDDEEADPENITPWDQIPF